MWDIVSKGRVNNGDSPIKCKHVYPGNTHDTDWRAGRPPPPHTWRGVLPTDPGYGMGTAYPRLADRTLPTKWHYCYYRLSNMIISCSSTGRLIKYSKLCTSYVDFARIVTVLAVSKPNVGRAYSSLDLCHKSLGLLTCRKR